MKMQFVERKHASITRESISRNAIANAMYTNLNYRWIMIGFCGGDHVISVAY